MTIGKINFCAYSVNHYSDGKGSFTVKSQPLQSTNNVTVQADTFCEVGTCRSEHDSFEALKEDIEKAGFNKIRGDFRLRRGFLDIYNNKNIANLNGTTIPANSNMYFIKNNNNKIEYILHEFPQSKIFINKYNPITGENIDHKIVQCAGACLKDDLKGIDMRIAFLIP